VLMNFCGWGGRAQVPARMVATSGRD
jgi:hypothetical protein